MVFIDIEMDRSTNKPILEMHGHGFPSYVVTRFAPSPTHRLHKGNIHAAYFAFRIAMDCGGRFRLRIEDIDPVRCKPEFIDDIFTDLRRLGLDWSGGVPIQSNRMPIYANRLNELKQLGVLYPCFCSRKSTAAFLSAPHTPEKHACPQNCKHLSGNAVSRRVNHNEGFALKLDMRTISKSVPTVSFTDCRRGVVSEHVESLTDVIVARKDMATGYHLSCVVDDDAQGVNMITRGEDLLDSTPVQRILQILLKLKEPRYCHHPLLYDPSGKRMSKRYGAPDLDEWLLEESTVASIRRVLSDWYARLWWEAPRKTLATNGRNS